MPNFMLNPAVQINERDNYRKIHSFELMRASVCLCLRLELFLRLELRCESLFGFILLGFIALATMS